MNLVVFLLGMLSPIYQNSHLISNDETTLSIIETSSQKKTSIYGNWVILEGFPRHISTFTNERIDSLIGKTIQIKSDSLYFPDSFFPDSFIELSVSCHLSQVNNIELDQECVDKFHKSLKKKIYPEYVFKCFSSNFNFEYEEEFIMLNHKLIIYESEGGVFLCEKRSSS